MILLALLALRLCDLPVRRACDDLVREKTVPPNNEPPFDSVWKCLSAYELAFLAGGDYGVYELAVLKLALAGAVDIEGDEVVLIRQGHFSAQSIEQKVLGALQSRTRIASRDLARSVKGAAGRSRKRLQRMGLCHDPTHDRVALTVGALVFGALAIGVGGSEAWPFVLGGGLFGLWCSWCGPTAHFTIPGLACLRSMRPLAAACRIEAGPLEGEQLRAVAVLRPESLCGTAFAEVAEKLRRIRPRDAYPAEFGVARYDPRDD